MTDQDYMWERRVITRLAHASLQEQKRARRWGIFFKLLAFAYLTFILVVYTSPDITSSKIASEHTALVELTGLIADGEESSADNIITALRTAFKDDKTKGVVLRINSPGGTPVQAGYIYDEIVRLREKYPDTPLYAVISDLCASGGYYVASAADEIYASEASIVGSIGVRIDSYGFVDTMNKLGVERRTLTAGEHKAMLDPFAPADKEAMQHLQKMIDEIHQQFITAVKKGRGDRVKDMPKVFSGLVWTGSESRELGLVDRLGSASFVAREVIGAEDIVEYTVEEDIFKRLADRIGTAAARVLGRELLTPAMQ